LKSRSLRTTVSAAFTVFALSKYVTIFVIENKTNTRPYGFIAEGKARLGYGSVFRNKV
jgi:hypothetical protein